MTPAQQAAIAAARERLNRRMASSAEVPPQAMVGNPQAVAPQMPAPSGLAGLRDALMTAPMPAPRPAQAGLVPSFTPPAPTPRPGPSATMMEPEPVAPPAPVTPRFDPMAATRREQAAATAERRAALQQRLATVNAAIEQAGPLIDTQQGPHANAIMSAVIRKTGERDALMAELAEIDAHEAEPTAPVAPAMPDDRPEPTQSRLASAGRSAVEGFLQVPSALAGAPSLAISGLEHDVTGSTGNRVEGLQRQIREIAVGIAEAQQQGRDTTRQQAMLAQAQENLQALLSAQGAMAAPRTPDQLPGFGLRDDIRAWGTDTFGAPDPAYRGDFTTDLAAGGGNMLGFMATALPSALLGPAGFVGTAAAGAAVGSDAAYESAIEHGASPEDAIMAARIMGAVGITEAAPIITILQRIPGGRGAKAAFVRKVLENATEEGIQEAFQGVMENLTASDFVGYDPERGTLDNVGRQALIGAILGGGMGGASGAYDLATRRSEPGPRRESAPPAAPAQPQSLSFDAPASSGGEYQGLAAVLAGAPAQPGQPVPPSPPTVSSVPDAQPASQVTAPDVTSPAADLAAVIAGTPPAPAGDRSAPVAPAAPARTDTPPAVGAASLPPNVALDPRRLGPDEEYMEADVGLDGQPIDPIPGIWNSRLRQWRPLDAGQGTPSTDQITSPQVDSAPDAQPMSQPEAPNVTSPDPRADLAAALAGQAPAPVARPSAMQGAFQPRGADAAPTVPRSDRGADQIDGAAAAALSQLTPAQRAAVEAAQARLAAKQEAPDAGQQDRGLPEPGAEPAAAEPAAATPARADERVGDRDGAEQEVGASAADLEAAYEAKKAEHAAAYHEHQRLRRGRTDENKAKSAEAFRRYQALGYEVDEAYRAWSEALDREDAAAVRGNPPARDEITGLPIVDGPTPDSFWTYKAETPPDYASLPEGVFSGTRQEWESMTPGMRREIVRTAQKRGPVSVTQKPEAPRADVAPDITDPMSGEAKDWWEQELSPVGRRRIIRAAGLDERIVTPSRGWGTLSPQQREALIAKQDSAVNTSLDDATSTPPRIAAALAKRNETMPQGYRVELTGDSGDTLGLFGPDGEIVQAFADNFSRLSSGSQTTLLKRAGNVAANRGQRGADAPTVPVADARAEQKKREAREAGRKAGSDGEARKAPDFMAGSGLADEWLAGYAEGRLAREAAVMDEAIDEEIAASQPVEKTGTPAMDPDGKDAARFWRDLTPEAQTAALAAAGVEKTRPRPWQFVAKADRAKVLAEAQAGIKAAKATKATDNQPRPGNPVPLYVERKLTPESAAEIVAWAKEQGFPSTLLPDDLHVTIAYSKAPVDVGKAKAMGGGRATTGISVEKLGAKGAVVLMVEPRQLPGDWQRYRDAGASWDHGDTYRPHITITYDAKGVDLDRVEPFTGPIHLQGETQKALELNRTGTGAIKEQPTGTTGQRKANTTDAGIELPELYDKYFSAGEDTTLVPIDKLRPLRARPEGIANAGRFMREAFDGDRTRRKPISVRREDDGTYTVLDGNSTFANMQQAGWGKVPVRVLTDAQFARESAPKFIEKIAGQTRQAVTLTIADDGAITVRGFEAARDAVMARAKKEGLNVTFRALPEPAPGKPVMLRSLDKADERAFEKALQDGQPEADIDAALRVAAGHQAAIAAPFNEIAEATGATASVPPDPKSKKSALDKMERKKATDARRLTDLPRGGFLVQTPEQGEAVARMLRERFAAVDEDWNITDAGYFDRKLLLRMDDGMLVEVQIWEPNLLNAKEKPTLYPEAGHLLYEQWRDVKATPEAQADANRKMLEVYGAALDAASPAWRDLIASSKKGQSDPNLAMNSSRDSSGAAPSRSKAAVSPSETLSEKGSTTSVTPESSSTAGSLSQSKKRIEPSVSASNVGEPSAPNISTPAAQDKAWGQENTIFTADAAQKARELLRKKLGGTQLNAGIDPEVVQAGITLAGYHIEAGARRFGDYARAMVGDLGESVRPYLRSWYEGVRYYPGFDAEGMTPAAEITDADSRGLDQDGAGEGQQGDRAGVRDEGPGSGEALDGAPAADGEAAAGAEPAAAAGEGAGASQDGGGDSLRQGRDGAERGAGDGDSRVSDAGTGDGADAGPRPAARPSRPNYVLDKPERIVGGTPKQRFAKNRAAIEAMQAIEQEGREPTQAELDAMAAYTGWGAFGQELFQGSWDVPRPKAGWETENQWLRDTLGKEAWQGAQASIINAHYTDPPTVKAMWGIVEKLGFKGGRVLEPSMGVGNFFSMMPQNIAQASDLTGIELDPTTGAMAKHLFPQANIQIKGYEKSRTPDDFYDLVIGNWPFANLSPADRRYDRLGLSLHNYFFVKALDQTRPGGLVVGVTSRFTMDAQGRQARMEMAKRADLVAAFRLPTGAFEEYAGTAVVTDIIVLKKRESPNPNPAGEAWVETGTVKLGWQNEGFPINRYYLDNPSNVLGEIALGQRTTFGAPGLTVTRQDNFPRRLSALPSRVPEGVYQPIVRGKEPRFTANQTSEREGAVVENSGELHVVQGERLANLHDLRPWKLKDEAETANRLRQFKDMIGIRRAYESLIAAERAGAADIKSIRGQLKNLHSAFVAAHGPMVDSFALKHMERVDDPHYATLAALEGPDGKPATIMDRSTMRPQPNLANPTVRDAYVLARNENTVLDMARIAELAGVDEATARADLIESGAVYAVPGGGVEAADVYLSGNVVRKLAEARDAAERGEDMARSIAALEKARPAKVPYFSIEPQLGATWISVPIHQQFIAEMLGVDSLDGIDIRMVGGGWRVKLPNSLLSRPEAKAGMGSADVRFDRLVTAAMGNRPLTIFGRDLNGKPVKDDAASKRASEAAQRVREHFNEWAYKDAERRIQLEREYNDTFRAVADPQFDGSFLTFPGLARQFYGGDFDLRQHQRNAVWRGVANGYGIYAHEVGTGKTATAAAIAVESKRYGKAKKPVLFAHNANSRAVYAEAQGMYPGANMLFVDNLSPKTIKTTLRRIANDDWDLIVMPHSVIDRLSFKEETLKALAQEQIAALEQEALEAAQEDGHPISLRDLDDPDSIKKMRSVTAKELAKQRQRILAQIDKMAARANRGEDTINFEDLGIDMILVDEAHVFKKPPIATKMQMRGLNRQASDRSIALQFITDHVKAQRGGTGIHLFTGTPITNTLGEIFHMSRYVISKDMEAANVADWDAWFNTFAAAGADVEPAAGGGFDIVTRLRKFVNVAELRRMMGTALDVVFADDMPEFKPRTTASGKTMADENLTAAERDELLNGRSPNAIGRPYKVTVNDIAPISPGQRWWMEQIAAWAREWKSMDGKDRLEAMKAGDPQSPIIHENIAPKVGLDLRMVEQGAPDEADSKINRAVRRILHHYQESPDGAQVVFAEVGDARESKVAGNRIILDRSPIEDLIEKLVEGGVRRDEIAVVGGGVKPEQKQAIAAQVNRGEVRVVIGKTETLGTGVNMQKRLRAMHHLDAPWMPGQLEQRNGRGWRQGNQWNTVYEYRYITEGIDGARWNVLAVKDRFITDFKRADDSVREIEGDAVDDAEKADGDSIMATLSEAIGDPRVLQKEKLTKDVERLNRKERLHSEGIADTKSRARQSRQEAQQIEREVKEGWEPDAALAEKVKAAEGFEAKIGNRTYQKRADAADALQQEIQRQLPEIMRAVGYWGEVTPVVLGEIGGFEVVAKFLRHGTQPYLAVRGSRIHEMGATSLASAESVIRGIPKKAADKAAEAAELRKSAARLDAMAKQPFALADQLAKRKAMLVEIDTDLRDNPVAPPMWLRRGAPVDTKINVRGEARVVRGHRWATNGWFVLTDEGAVPYLDARDQYGVPIYQEVPFSEPADGSAVEIDPRYLLDGQDKTLTEMTLDDDGNLIVREQRGWHGSPYTFDAFSTAFMGSGEGAQAFGWGLYFAGHRKLGEFYRDQLASKAPLVFSPYTVGRWTRRPLASVDTDADFAAAIAAVDPEAEGDARIAFDVMAGLVDRLPSVSRSGLPDLMKGATSNALQSQHGISQQDAWRRSDRLMAAMKKANIVLDVENARGRLYQVEIPDNDTLMDWDEPMRRQPKAVRDKLGQFEADYNRGRTRGRTVLPAFKDATGDEFYRGISIALGGDRAASEALANAGVPGHRYANGQTRNRASRSDEDYNYVIYEDAAVSVISRERRTSPYSDLGNNDRFRAATAPEQMAKLRRMLDHYGLKRVLLMADPAGAGRQGAFAMTADGQRMAILMGASFDPAATLNHEVIHALRAANLFTESEWAILERAARDRWMARHKIAERYGDLSEAQQIEEAIAEAFAEGMKGTDTQIERSPARIAWAKVKRFFQVMKRWLGLQKLTSPDQIFGAVASGVIGRGPRQDMTRYAREVMAKIREQRDTSGWDAAAWKRAMRKHMGLDPKLSNKAARDAFIDAMESIWGATMTSLKAREDLHAAAAGRVEMHTGHQMRDGGAPDLEQRTPFTVRAEQRAVQANSFFAPAPGMLQAYRQTQGTYAAIRAGTSPKAVESTFDYLRRMLQDKMLPLMRAQQALEAQGVQISEAADVYLTEETYSGRVGARLRRIERRYIEPVMDIIAKSNGLTIDSVARYLTARHAPERNAHVASINPAMPDGGAGFDGVANTAWTTQHAQQVRRQMEAGPDGAALQRIARLMRELRRRSIAQRVDYGLLSADEGRAWLDKFREYVPLKGFAETDGAEPFGAGGSGFNAGGPETRRAMGRESEAFNPLVAAFTQAQEAIVRGEKNRVGQAFYELVKSAPKDNGLFEVKTVRLKRYFNQSTGLVETRAVNPITVPQADRELAVKIDGQEHRVVIHNPAIMQAMRNLGAEQMNAMLRMSRAMTQWLSMANTMFSPAFIAVNGVRDMMTAHIQAPSIAGADAGPIMADARANYIAAMRAAARGVKGDYSGVWGKVYRDYENAGGKIEFFRIQNPEDSLDLLEARMRIATGKGSISDHVADWQRKRVIAWVERMNLAVDNALRLAAFKAAKDRGWSDKRAASLSKNLTVNFNRRGQYGSAINAVIMFYNAGAQGLHMMAKAMHRKEVWAKYLIPLIALGIAEDIIMSALSGEDDDGELAYDKVPAWHRSMALLFGVDGSGFSVPLPYNFNMFAFMGKQISRVARGGVDMATAFGEIVEASLATVSPPITPTLYEPYRAWTQNTDWRGRPIRPEYAYADFGPKSHKAYGNTSDLAKAISASLNWMTGGSEHHAGAVDIAPGYLDHFAGWVAGGLGRVAQQSWRSAEQILSGEAPDISAVPVVSRFGWSTGIWLDRERFYTRRDEVKAAAKVARDGGPQALRARDRALLSIEPQLKAAERTMRNARQLRAQAHDTLTGEARRTRLQQIEAMEQRALDQFNGAYNRAAR